MLKDFLSKQKDSVLWSLLADIGGVMESRTKPTQTDVIWTTLATEVTNEIDKRLANDYDNGDCEEIENETSI